MTKENSNVPAVTFKVRVPDPSNSKTNSCEIVPSTWAELTTDEIFKDKLVVVFSLPGAFTPTCSTFQLPGFELYAQDFYDIGVSDIYCISVNDSFVMNAWRDANNLKNVKVLPDEFIDKTEKKYEEFIEWWTENYELGVPVWHKGKVSREKWLDAAYGIKRLRGMINFARSEDWTRRLPEFREYLSKLDAMRGTDFRKTFPDMAYLMDDTDE